MAGAEPVIIVDTREQDPLPFARLKTRGGTLTNHEFLRDLAESYLENAGGKLLLPKRKHNT